MKKARRPLTKLSFHKFAPVCFAAVCAFMVFAAGCKKRTDLSEGQRTSCEIMSKPGPESNNMGPGDFNANYHGFAAPLDRGEKIVMKSQFPHARYISINVYDENLRLVDAIRDRDIVPSRGVNPFVPGTKRSGDYLGEYEITIVMGPPPSGERPPNTLYGGLTNTGGRNHAVLLGYRVYLPDKGMGYRDGHPQGVYGGVPPPRLTVYDPNGDPYCPPKSVSKMVYYHGAYSVLWSFMEQTRGGQDEGSGPQDPPVWFNQYSREGRHENVVVGNDETIYISAPVSSEFGELLVLQWPAAETPVESYHGRPIAEDTDMRYWSLAFAYRDSSYFAGFPTEKSLSDVDVPRLSNGDCRLVIGFGGMERPDFVPVEQWVGLEMEEGLIIMRNIMIDPAYEGDFGELPRGKISGEMRKHTPGGVYCSVEELRENPEMGDR